MLRHNLITLLALVLAACAHATTPAPEAPLPTVEIVQAAATPTPTYWLVSASIDHAIDSRGHRVAATLAGLQPGEYGGQITLITSDKILYSGHLRFYLIIVTQIEAVTGVVNATLAIPASGLALERAEVASTLQAHATPLNVVLLGDSLAIELFVTINAK
jgi:hypothetical protein